jgi:hypothetical protein
MSSLRVTRQRLAGAGWEWQGLGLVLLLALAPLAGRAATEGAAGTLTNAAAAGDVARVRSVLRSGVSVNVRDEQGRTALLLAAEAGHVAVVKALIEAKADVNASDQNGLSALIAAARRDDLEMARVLLLAGARPDASHRGYGMALDIAEREGHKDLAALLRERGARGSGASVGSIVCVRPWKGQGYCGTVTAIEAQRRTLRVTRLVGCEKGCAASECSMGRTVGGSPAGNVQAGDSMVIAASCLTQIGLLPENE